jgi:Fe-S-cluster containining protein
MRFMTAVADFKCMRCGNCCTINGSVGLTQIEVDSAAAYLKLGVEDFTDQYTELTANRMGLMLKDHDDGSCIFLGDNRLCEIEEVKPKQCRGFPVEWNYDEWKKVCSANYPNTGCPQEGNI